MTGETPDIQISLSGWTWSFMIGCGSMITSKKIQVDGSGRRLAQWLGVAHRVGSDLCYWLLLESGKVIAQTTVQYVTRDDVLNGETKQQIDQFDMAVTEQLTDIGVLIGDAGTSTLYLHDEENDTGVVNPNPMTPLDEEYGDMLIPDTLEADDIDDATTNKYLNAESMFDVGASGERRGRVIKRAKGVTGDPIGRTYANPLFDTREYVVEFTDGTAEN